MPFTVSSFTYNITNISSNFVDVTGCTLSIGSIIIPNQVIDPTTNITYKVTGIGDNVFLNKSGLTSITFQDNLKDIGNYSFKGCSGLTSISIPNLLTIDNFAFSECTKLNSVSLPKVYSVLDDVFSGCSGLTSISLPSLQIAEDNLFKNCVKLTTCSLPLLTTIGRGMFQGCILLNSFSFPVGVTGVGASMFQGCISLTSISLPNVTEIDTSSFQDCTLLSSITFPKLKKIQSLAFSGCTSLTSITLPNTVTNINTTTFNTNNMSIIFDGTSENILIMSVTSTSFRSNSIFIFNNILTSSEIESTTTTSLYYNYYYNVIGANYLLGCFLTDSNVLTNKKYVKIQDLKKGDLVKTLNHGFIPIKFVGKQTIYNYPTEKRINSHLYKLNKKDFIELTEDLFITGGHPLLIDNLNEEIENKLFDMAEMGTPIITEGKYRVFAMLHPKAELWNEEGMKDIYDIVLENEDPHRNYGIYVNGILTESMDEDFFLNYSKMTEINNI